MTRFALIAAVALLSACAGGGDYRDQSVEMRTEGPVDLERYMGRWYEIARFPNSFEEGCAGVTADYSLNDDGTVKVVNTCRQGGVDGPTESAEGVAESVSANNDRLEVSFVPWLPFAAGDYWILDLNDDYTTAVVGAPSGGVGWVLARTPTIPEPELSRAFEVLRANGYETDAITLTPQPPA